MWSDDYVGFVNGIVAELAEQDINKIVLLTHIGDYIDLEIIEQFDGVDFSDSNWGVTLNESVAVLHCKLKEQIAAIRVLRTYIGGKQVFPRAGQ